MMVNFEVVLLFTQVPVGEALTIIQTKYKLPEHIVELTKHCFSNTYFTYEGQRYKQVQGAPMGSPLFPALANLFVEDLEEKAIMTSTHKPKLWIRYADDTFVIWPHGETKLREFLEHLNNLHAAIKFTMQREQQNQLPFLDVLSKKKQD